MQQAEQIMDRVREIVRDVFNDPDLPVTEETTALMVPGWDSMAQIKILMAVEEEFAVQFGSREMDQLRNVGDIVALIIRNTNK
jgi:acyl carrier protein